jgi:hypothetical protein
VKPSDLRHDWDGTDCVTWSLAQQLYVKMLAEKGASLRAPIPLPAKTMRARAT